MNIVFNESRGDEDAGRAIIMKKKSRMTVFEMVMAGLEESIAYSKGEKHSLITVKRQVARKNRKGNQK